MALLILLSAIRTASALAPLPDVPPAIRATPATLAPHDETIVTLDANELVHRALARGDLFSWHDGNLEWIAPGGTFLPSRRGASVDVAFPGGVAQPVQVLLRNHHGELLDKAGTVLQSVGDGSGWTLTGPLIAWQPMEFVLTGPASSEMAVSPNPFLDFRMKVTFQGPHGREYEVQGFFDGDGQGGDTGDVWKARFSPDVQGPWTFEVDFERGFELAVELNPGVGSPTVWHGITGAFEVLPLDPEAEGFYRLGRLEYVGEHYLKFRDGPYFIKGGTDSPENFMGYEGFDDIEDLGNQGIIHEFEEHIGDWVPGDPLFTSSSTGTDSKGIIGALNYLSSAGINSIYFLPMNLGGDGRETCPFVAYAKTTFNKTHYDISRMHQWNTVFEHAQRRGIQLQFVLSETETGNETWLDGGALGVERKLFFRELVARFGHHLAIKWNLAEEPDFFNSTELQQHARFVKAFDAYDHPLAVHTKTFNVDEYVDYLGNPDFTATSIQYDLEDANDHVEAWRFLSAAAGHRWVIDLDENAPASVGLSESNAPELRKRALYDIYFSGGNLEWYAGSHPDPVGGDLTVEDFRIREEMWDYTRIAREFMQDHLPFWEMEPADSLLTGEAPLWGGGQVFAKVGEHYAIYLPAADGDGMLDLSDSGLDGLSLPMQLRWFNPRTGEFEGTPRDLFSGGVIELGAPPRDAHEDWVCWITRVRGQPASVAPEPDKLEDLLP